MTRLPSDLVRAPNGASFINQLFGASAGAAGAVIFLLT
jgi:hypothetical protein